MSPEEARLFLKFDEEEELEDAFELALFDIRQFVVSKPVLLKTFQSRQVRIAKLREAFQTLGGEEPAFPPVSSVDFQPSAEVSEQFRRYHAAKNELKRQLSHAANSEQMEQLIQAFIELERAFVAPFSDYSDWTAREVLISKEPDSMLVLSFLREQAEKGLKTLEDLYKNRNNLPAELVLELKRLSLHKNYLYE